MYVSSSDAQRFQHRHEPLKLATVTPSVLCISKLKDTKIEKKLATLDVKFHTVGLDSPLRDPVFMDVVVEKDITYQAPRIRNLGCAPMIPVLLWIHALSTSGRM